MGKITVVETIDVPDDLHQLSSTEIITLLELVVAASAGDSSVVVSPGVGEAMALYLFSLPLPERHVFITRFLGSLLEHNSTEEMEQGQALLNLDCALRWLSAHHLFENCFHPYLPSDSSKGDRAL